MLEKLIEGLHKNLDGMKDNTARANWLYKDMQEKDVPSDIQDIIISVFMSIYA